jgi:hypothetical protein
VGNSRRRKTKGDEEGVHLEGVLVSVGNLGVPLVRGGREVPHLLLGVVELLLVAAEGEQAAVAFGGVIDVNEADKDVNVTEIPKPIP